MNTLILTVGLPRSGKTTWARSTAYPIVCPDAIRLALHGQRFQALAEPIVWAIAKVMVRALFLAGHEVVVVDATNTTRKRRDEWRSDDWSLRFARIPTDEVTCLQRALQAGDHEIVPIIVKQAAVQEPLESDEAEWVA